jgi:DNA repair exonuclease SbcCD nuclease subunit
MKVALITDTHFGARSDSIPFDNFFAKFYTEVFFPHLEQAGIKTIIHLGDVFDRRKFINYNTLKKCREYFFDKTRDLGIDVHMIAGNHDTFFKNTNEVNSLDLLLREYGNVITYSDAEEIKLDGKNLLLVPWICSGNYQETMEVVDKSNAQAVFGHFEFSGFEMYRGHKNDHGMGTERFDRFPLVCSGHFHHRSRTGNILYLGNTYEFTWSDYNDPRGYHLYDTETNEVEFFENPFQIFHKIYYDDTTGDPSLLDLSTLVGSCVRLVVVKKTDFYKFDRFVDKLYDCDLIELKIIEDFSEFEADVIEEDKMDVEDTMTVLSDFVDTVSTDLDKDKIKNLLRTLYIEAQHVSV